MICHLSHIFHSNFKLLADSELKAFHLVYKFHVDVYDTEESQTSHSIKFFFIEFTQRVG